MATWFQQRGWAWQSKVAQVEKDTTSALDSLHSTSDLLDKRWSATFQMVQAIENKEGDEAKAIRDTFLSVNNDWELQYANTDASVEFNVDRPFGVDAKRMPDAVWLFQCNAFPFDGKGGIDPNSAHTILTVINHCQDLVKTGIQDLGKTPGDQTARKRLIDDSYFRLSNIYYIDDALRRVILERAVAMRRSLDTELSLGSFFRIGPQTYNIPVKESDCVAPYRDWSAKNPPKQQ
ncbi:hypothetical protein [Methylocella sp.]|uniref:hypothetical protein n=1 Tax=Methylocella sp. TaxID=1978226 RepID=UPI003C1FD72F